MKNVVRGLSILTAIGAIVALLKQDIIPGVATFFAAFALGQLASMLKDEKE